MLVFNLIFYGWGEPVYIVIMFLSTAIDYTHGMLVDRCKRRGNDQGARRAVASSVIFNLALLFFFKYWDFVAQNLAAAGIGFIPVLGLELPIGISFYTFQTMSYTIDVYRGDTKVQHSILNFGTFVTLFPQLIAGPIIKYKDLGDQIDHRDHTAERFASGVQIFMVGLAKKVLLANNIGMLWDVYKATPVSELTVAGAWLGVLAFAFQIYFDFSGYSDMAIGLGRMFGFHFEENFNYPYLSQSVSEFWRRWHMSLSGWFRDYVYIPLGGSRCGQAKQIRNVLVVWMLTGIWHGAAWNFFLWGLYFALLLPAERFVWKGFLTRSPRAVRHVYAMVLIVLGWVLFRCESLSAVGSYLAAMAGFSEGAVGQATYFLKQYGFWLLAGAVASLPVRDWLKAKLPEGVQRWAVPVTALVLLGFSFLQLISSTFNPFIYYRF